jgi:hypothetical protein
MYKYKIFSSVTILLAAAGPFAVAQAEGIEDSIHLITRMSTMFQMVSLLATEY